MGYQIGDVLKGTVTGIQPYGAFVQLDKEHQGLIHISECRSAFIQHVRDELALGEEVEVLVLNIDEYSQKISLSRRGLSERERLARLDYRRIGKQGPHYFWTNRHVKLGFSTIKQAIPTAIQESLQRLRG